MVSKAEYRCQFAAGKVVGLGDELIVIRHVAQIVAPDVQVKPGRGQRRDGFDPVALADAGKAGQQRLPVREGILPETHADEAV